MIGNSRTVEFPEQTGIYFLRISNYLNYLKDELLDDIDEKYLDLRFEEISNYDPNDPNSFLKDFEQIFRSKFKKFDLIAISCYSSYEYLNTVEIACYIKNRIDPKTIIVVGGVHPTFCPEDFQLVGIPTEFKKKYSLITTPFDFLIQGEGEIPFYKLVRDIVMDNKKIKLPLSCEIRESEFIKDLNDVPLLDLSLFERYKERYRGFILQIDFSRGCPFKCKFCINSIEKVKCYRTVRIKSIEKYLAELKIIINSGFNFNTIKISDPLFLPKRTMRSQFFSELDKNYDNGKNFPFNMIEINERIEICTKDDLDNYKKYRIKPNFGLETVSKSLLKRLGKVLGKNEDLINKGIENYLKKFKKLVQWINEINLIHRFNFLANPISEDIQSYKEIEHFLFNPNDNLIKEYKINFRYAQYRLYVGTELYRNAEKDYGSKIHFKEWWKIFDKDQFYYSYLFEPSEKLDFLSALKRMYELRKRIYNEQKILGNLYYTDLALREFNAKMFKIILLYKSLNLANK